MKLLCLVLVGFVLFGCATHSGWQPTVDSYDNPNADRIPQDMAECKQLSAQASGDGAKQEFDANSTYKNIFIKCMRNRGHTVLTYRYGK